MGLDHDGTSGGKRGCGIAAGHGESEREVAGAEDGDRTERAQHGAEIGPRDGWRSGMAGSMRA